MDKIFNEIISASPQKLVFSKPKAKTHEYKKIVITRKKGSYQAEKLTQKQAFHENISEDKLSEYCLELAGTQYMQCNAFGADTEFILMISSKGKTTFKKKRTSAVCNIKRSITVKRTIS